MNEGQCMNLFKMVRDTYLNWKVSVLPMFACRDINTLIQLCSWSRLKRIFSPRWSSGLSLAPQIHLTSKFGSYPFIFRQMDSPLPTRDLINESDIGYIFLQISRAAHVQQLIFQLQWFAAVIIYFIRKKGLLNHFTISMAVTIASLTQTYTLDRRIKKNQTMTDEESANSFKIQDTPALFVSTPAITGGYNGY